MDDSRQVQGGAASKRKDARRNQQSLLDAAAAVFATSGVDAPVREIAARAGVGTGTVYRHFPTRADLVIAVYRHQVDTCAEAGPVLLAAGPTPSAALERWVDLFIDFLVTKHGLAAAMQADGTGYEALHSYFLDRLLPVVYGELRRIASRQLRHERAGHTLQPTALVHEAYVRLVAQHDVDWRSRAHFFGVAAHVMRRILVDYARRQTARKRGDGAQKVPLEHIAETPAPAEIPLLALNSALDRLEKLDRGLARIVELRAFAGLSIDEAAHVLNVSSSTANREWRIAKAWLTRELTSANEP